MSHTPHELVEEFPEHVALMHKMRETDAHFTNLSDRYHTINKAVHRAETDIEPTNDEHLLEIRKERMKLKDEIYRYLVKQTS